MDKLVFRDNVYLKAKDLVEGCVYISKDGRVMLYLGVDVTGKYIFYICGAVTFTIKDYGYTISNYDTQVKYIIEMCKELFSKAIYYESILCYKTLPKIYGLFPYMNCFNNYGTWYSKSMFLDDNLPKLSSLSDKKADKWFVGAKELIPGHLYYSGDCWRSSFVYLGRKSTKEFVWVFIGNEKVLVKQTGVSLLSSRVLQIDVTKSNKKVKPLAEALNDSNAFVSTECKMLIQSGFSVNMTGVTQELLDSAY